MNKKVSGIILLLATSYAYADNHEAANLSDVDENLEILPMTILEEVAPVENVLDSIEIESEEVQVPVFDDEDNVIGFVPKTSLEPEVVEPTESEPEVVEPTESEPEVVEPKNFFDWLTSSS